MKVFNGEYGLERYVVLVVSAAPIVYHIQTIHVYVSISSVHCFKVAAITVDFIPRDFNVAGGKLPLSLTSTTACQRRRTHTKADRSFSHQYFSSGHTAC
jgi:hypothetical protein